MIDAAKLTEEQLDEMAEAFSSTKECDEVCLNLFIKSKWSLHKTVEWAKSDKLYVKRAAFMIMLGLARQDMQMQNFVFRVFIPILKRESVDQRPEIQEAITWAFEAIAERHKDFEKREEK